MTDIPFTAVDSNELGDSVQKGYYVTNGRAERLVQYATELYGN